MQFYMKLLPSMHSVSLIRSLYMKASINTVFDGAPEASLLEYQEYYGITIEIDDYVLLNWQLVLLLALFGGVFYLLTMLKLRKSKM